MSRPNLIAVFSKFPKELFRVNNGPSIHLRIRRPHKYQHDVVPQGGLILPKALDPASYSAPNGASMRPNSKYQQSLVRWGFHGDDVIVYSVAKGTELPDDLLLVHERSDHYSLQPAVPLTLDELDKKITRFFTTKATLLAKAQWIKAYPKATEKF